MTKKIHMGSYSFTELRCKEVVNSVDGKRLGRIIDIVFGINDGLVMGIVVPHSRRNIIFRNNEPIFIPWHFIERIGEDIIMVRLAFDNFSPVIASRDKRDFYDEYARLGTAQIHNTASDYDKKTNHDSNDSNKRNNDSDAMGYIKNNNIDQTIKTQSVFESNLSNNKDPKPDCDNQCQKCMLFDCQHRWDNDYPLTMATAKKDDSY